MIQLKRTVAQRAELRDPLCDVFRTGQKRSQAAHSTGVGNGNRQANKAGTRHRRLENGRLQTESLTELHRPISCARGS